jgi:hypothetical protein
MRFTPFTARPRMGGDASEEKKVSSSNKSEAYNAVVLERGPSFRC